MNLGAILRALSEGNPRYKMARVILGNAGVDTTATEDMATALLSGKVINSTL